MHPRKPEARDIEPQLIEVRYALPHWANPERFPFCVPAIASMTALSLDSPVVCFVGENGSGKSTLLEAIAISASLPSAGSAGRANDDPTLADQLWLSRALKLSWRTRNNRGLFLRAEDFFGFQLLLKRERAEFVQTLERMDEPEAALSPQRQLTLLAMMFDLVAEGAQFIIATHSPLLLAFPGARIYSFDESSIEQTEWEQTEHVRLTRDFLANPERYLRNLKG